MRIQPGATGHGSASTNPAASLAELAALVDHGDESACLDYLRDVLYPAGTPCPKCERTTRFHRVRGRSAYSCQYCGWHVYPTAGTIFRRSTTSLRSWFRAIQLIGSQSGAVTAGELEREIGVTRKTASRMLARIAPVVRDGSALLLVHPPAADADVSGAAGTQPEPPSQVTAGQRPGPTPGLSSSDLVRAELLASREGLLEDLRVAELREREVREEVEALRHALATIERLSADERSE